MGTPAHSAAIQTEIRRLEPEVKKMGKKQKPGCFFTERLSYFPKEYSNVEVE